MTKLSRAFLGRLSEKGSLRQNGPWRISCFAQNFYLKNFFNSINFDCTLTAAANSVQKSFQKNERKMQLKRWRRRTKENHLKSHFNKLTKLKGHLGWNLYSSLPKLIPFKKIRKISQNIGPCPIFLGSLFVIFSNANYKKEMWIMIHPVSGARIRTYDRSGTSFLS